MQAEIVESVQHSVTPGSCRDIYYPGESNSDLQCFPTTVENRFYVDLPSLDSGSTSTIIFNPDQGLSDIVLTATLPAPSGSVYTNWALPRGWLPAMISQVGLRVGGSSLYYWSGDQIAIDTLAECEDAEKKNAVFQLGGAECLTLADYSSTLNRTGYAYIKMPFNSISALQKPLCLPTDLLTQPVQLLIQFKPFSQVFFPLAGALQSDLPTRFASAAVNFKQTHMQDQGHLLARRENMNEKALTYPLRHFAQTTFRTTVSATAGQDLQLSLTGFRSGSVKYIDLWAVKQSDAVGGNPWNYVPILAARLSVNGLVYYDTRVASSQFWNLCERKTPASVNNTVLADAGGGSASATPSLTQWTVIPFSQVSEPMASENELVLGLPIANSVVNLTIQLPTTDTYVISAAYHYASSMLFSRGSAEYVF
jgi:hypothetical protein